MTTCRTVAETEAAGYAAGVAHPPMSQEKADYIAALLYPHRDLLAATSMPRPLVASEQPRRPDATGPGRPIEQDAA